MNKKGVVLSGMRPTGDLHIGHFLGVLHNWVQLQEDYQSFFMVADYHAMMNQDFSYKEMRQAVLSNVADWISAGIDPKQSTLFVQSSVRGHLELNMIFSALTPLGWLQRCPTFKDAVQDGEASAKSHAFLGYPVLQTADIALYNASHVPVGEDQLSHLELAREIIRRFHSSYGGVVFKEPQPLLSPVPKVLGTDGRKMSKSYHNTLKIAEEKENILNKVKGMKTDTTRIRLTDKGHPDQCDIFGYHKLFSQERLSEVRDWCENAKKGCFDCKKELAEAIDTRLGPLREKSQKFLKEKSYLEGILEEGAKKAQERADQTMDQVMTVMGKI